MYGWKDRYEQDMAAWGEQLITDEEDPLLPWCGSCGWPVVDGLCTKESTEPAFSSPAFANQAKRGFSQVRYARIASARISPAT